MVGPLVVMAALMALAAPAVAANVASSTTAGYFVSVSTPYTKATGSLKVPAFTCPATGEFTNEILLVWDTTDNVHAAATLVFVDLTCTDGAATLAGHAIERDHGTSSDPPSHLQEVVVPVSQGDNLSATFHYNPTSGAISFLVKNTTTRQTTTVRSTRTGLSFDHAEFVFQALTPGSCQVPAFSTIAVRTVAFDGHRLGTPGLDSATGFDRECGSQPFVRLSAITAQGFTFTESAS
jgi:hypothetical protein